MESLVHRDFESRTNIRPCDDVELKETMENSLVNPIYAGCELSFTPGLSSLFLGVRHHHMA